MQLLKIVCFLSLLSFSLHAVENFTKSSKLILDPLSGNLIALWTDIDNDTSNCVLKSSILKPGATLWPPGDVISDKNTSVVEMANYTQNPSGNLLVAWIASNFSLQTNTISVATLSFAGGKNGVWSSPKQISENKDAPLTIQDVVLDNSNKGNGNMWVSWISTKGKRGAVMLIAQGVFDTSGGVWYKPQCISVLPSIKRKK